MCRNINIVQKKLVKNKKNVFMRKQLRKRRSQNDFITKTTEKNSFISFFGSSLKEVDIHESK